MEKSTYLKKLKFDPRFLQSFIAKYLANPRLVTLLLTSIIILGIASYTGLPRRLNPEVKLPIVIVSTVLPGANPADVESLVTEPLEQEITGVNDVLKVTSTSRENVSVITIEFNSGIDPEKARTDTQSAIDSAELPEDAVSPRVQKIDFEDQPVWTFALTANGDTPSLTRFAKILKDELEDIDSIDRVMTSGLEEEEIQVLISTTKARNYGISPVELQQAVRSATSAFPAGNIRSDKSVFSLTIDPTVTSIQDLRSLMINVDDVSISLGEIAEITKKGKPDSKESYFASNTKTPERTVRFDIYKKATANIDKTAHDADLKIEELLKGYEGRFEIRSITNSAEMIDEQFGELIRDFFITIILVFIVLFIFLGIRQAIVSFLAVPLTFLISFTIMSVSGISLNFLSMFSLLLSLGLLVDDTIVVVSAMTSYYRTGKFTPLQTGLLVWKDFFIPILTTTLTTVWAFLPLLISTGIIGEFIKSIPIVVSSTLLASLGVAMLITLPLMILILRPKAPPRVTILFRIFGFLILLGIFFAVAPKGPLLILAVIALIIFLVITASVRMSLIKRSSKYIKNSSRKNAVVRNAPRYMESGIISFSKIGNGYKKILRNILKSSKNRKRTIAMVVIFSIFSYLLFPLGFVKNEFFPSSDQEFIYLSLEYPSGTNTDTTKENALLLLNEIKNTKDTNYTILDIGSAVSEFGGAGGAEGNNALFSIVLPKRGDRDKSSIEMAQELREKFATYTKGKVIVSEVSGGPPAGSDLQIKLFGDDLNELQNYATKVEEHLEKKGGVTDINRSIKPGTGKLVFIPDQSQLIANEITTDQIGLTLRSYASGFTLDTVKFQEDGAESTDISLRYGEQPEYVQSLSSISVSTPDGSFPLGSLGEIQLKPNPSLITREGGKRTISVAASVQEGYSLTTINSELENFAKSDLALKDGYSWETGGVNEENQKSVNSILVAMLLSFILIIVTMVIQFSSFRKALIVMLVIPLSISGVFIIFALTRTPLSFPALIGVLALFGIVVKNSILIVDKITANEKAGIPFTESIIDAAESRLEPIALTSATAIIGLIPITLSDPLWRGLGGAIIAGLTFSGTIMLFFIPVVYYYWFKEKNVTQIKRRRLR